MIPQKVRNRTESGVKCDIHGKGQRIKVFICLHAVQDL